MAHMMTSTDQVLARGSAWRGVEAREKYWRRVPAMPRILVARGRSDEEKNLQKGRSERLLSNDAICGLIGEVEAVVAARQWSLMYWSRSGGSGAAHKNDCK